MIPFHLKTAILLQFNVASNNKLRLGSSWKVSNIFAHL